jgi:hypothetical protein
VFSWAAGDGIFLGKSCCSVYREMKLRILWPSSWMIENELSAFSHTTAAILKLAESLKCFRILNVMYFFPPWFLFL